MMQQDQRIEIVIHNHLQIAIITEAASNGNGCAIWLFVRNISFFCAFMIIVCENLDTGYLKSGHGSSVSPHLP